MNPATKYSSALLLALLGGCATCRDHPVACKAVAAVVIAGAVIALDHRRADHDAPMARIPPPPDCKDDPEPCH